MVPAAGRSSGWSNPGANAWHRRVTDVGVRLTTVRNEDAQAYVIVVGPREHDRGPRYN